MTRRRPHGGKGMTGTRSASSARLSAELAGPRSRLRPMCVWKRLLPQPPPLLQSMPGDVPDEGKPMSSTMLRIRSLREC